jgi:predicted Zn-dependent protease
LPTEKKEEAAKYFQLAVKSDSENLEAKINYGMTLVNLARWDEAIEQLTPVAQLLPRRYLARAYLARATGLPRRVRASHRSTKASSEAQTRPRRLPRPTAGN